MLAYIFTFITLFLSLCLLLTLKLIRMTNDLLLLFDVIWCLKMTVLDKYAISIKSYFWWAPMRDDHNHFLILYETWLVRYRFISLAKNHALLIRSFASLLIKFTYFVFLGELQSDFLCASVIWNKQRKSILTRYFKFVSEYIVLFILR